MTRELSSALLLLALAIPAAHGQGLGCLPCAAVVTDDPEQLAAALEIPAPEDGAPAPVLFVKWDAELAAGPEAARQAELLRQAGATPVAALTLRAAAPILQNLADLEPELEGVATTARQLGDKTVFQVIWRPSAGAWSAVDYAFLLKRVAVAITGAAPDSRVLTAPLAADVEQLRQVWGEEISAYIDLVALEPAGEQQIRAATDALVQLDPGRAVLIDSVPLPAEPERALVESARAAAAGASGAFLRVPSPGPADLATILGRMAVELSGDLALDTATTALGAEAAWTFVRGEDLSLRIVAEPRAGDDPLVLRIADRFLDRPVVLDLAGAPPRSVGLRRRDDVVEVTIEQPGEAVLLRLDRLTAAEIEGLEGLEEELTIASERQMPVEEILRRLQAFEDDQARRIDHYQATNTTHLRFELQRTTTFETTFRGPLFFEQGGGYDWAWKEFLVNGVKWRGKKIPKIPLIQPERAAAMPLEIHFTKEYRYRLRGTRKVRGRDCWVVEFRPAAASEDRSLFQGTVFVDRDLYARVRTRAVQVGLAGDVISNEETIDYYPLDDAGLEAPWTRASYFLPTHTRGQQLWSLFNSTTVVETETRLGDIVLNATDFAERRDAVRSSDATMVRDTDDGMRYLLQDKESGERIVEAEPDTGRLFLVGGVFYDESFDFPIPLGGADYFNLDWKNTGAQVNTFFTLGLVTANIADPSFFGSRFDAGADLFAIAFAGTDEVYRDGRESPGEDVKSLPASFELDLGRPIGAFTKLEMEYGLDYRNYQFADDTAPDFALPSDNFTHSLALTARYNRAGYRLQGTGSWHRRSEWEPWGFADNPDYDESKETFTRWNATFAKNWHLQNFRRVGFELQYVDGDDLDRFSKYEFGYFSSVRVRGYQNDKIRAERATAAHLSYGFELGELIRLSGVGDLAWATDEDTGLDNEFLAGVGVVGTVTGPWQTLINLDLGLAVAGPDDGFSVFLAFLKLFGG
jgi:hypothetical protein